jgi:peptide chain release factor 1
LSALSKESGGHRIQRVPPTERKGRVHSSTVTVAVMETSDRKNIEFNDRDFRIEWYSGTGAGGQNRNKVMASCRLIHIPSGLVQSAQTRSRENSFKQAKEKILQLINDASSKTTQTAQSTLRTNQIGSGMRGDKRRTYRFQDDSVFDVETGKKASLKKVMSGNFDLLW